MTDTAPPPVFVPRPAAVVQRRAWLFWLAGALYGLPLVALLASLGHLQALHAAGVPFGTAMLVVVAMLLAGVVLFLGMIAGRWARREQGMLGVTTEAITVDGTPVVARSHVVQAVRTRGEAGFVVRISRRRRPAAKVEFTSAKDADDLVTALAQDAAHATVTFACFRKRGPSMVLENLVLGAVVFAAIAVPYGVMGVHTLLTSRYGMLFPCLIGFVVPAVFQVWRRTLVTGADGLVVRTLWKTSTFYPYGAIREVQRDGGDAILTLRSGKVLRFGFTSPSDPLRADRELVLEAFVARVTEGLARHAAGDVTSDLGTVLARGDRDVPSWKQALSELVRATSYRTSAVPPERLWRVVEDPTQPATARAGAAVALRIAREDAGTAPERTRLRVATAACASAELRQVLEAVDDEDESKLDRALRALEARR